MSEHGGIITPEEFAAKMREILTNRAEYDKETGHVVADDMMVQILKSLGYGEGAELFDNMEKWYS